VRPLRVIAVNTYTGPSVRASREAAAVCIHGGQSRLPPSQTQPSRLQLQFQPKPRTRHALKDPRESREQSAVDPIEHAQDLRPSAKNRNQIWLHVQHLHNHEPYLAPQKQAPQDLQLVCVALRRWRTARPNVSALGPLLLHHWRNLSAGEGAPP
jgi:hypothetical protein